MQGLFSYLSKGVASNDSPSNSNPQRRFWDWSRSVTGLTVNNPDSNSGTLAPGSSITLMDNVVSTALDGTTTFSVALSSIDSGTRYRYTWTGGTNPALRTNRGLTLSGSSVTFAINANSTVTVTTAGSFSGVVVGDTVFVPHTSTGDSANVLSLANAGFWTVIGVVSSTEIQMSRAEGESFSATAETISLTSNSQFVAFASSGGVQVGDKAAVNSPFATQGVLTVDRVTPSWFEVLSSSAIASEASVTPTASGLIFYRSAASFMRLEADQRCTIRLNGDTGNYVKVEPPVSGSAPGWMEKFGPTYKIVLVNDSTATVNYVLLTAE